jgi:glutaminase
MDKSLSVNGLKSLEKQQLELWINGVFSHYQLGTLPHYIPRLAQVDLGLFAVQVNTREGLSLNSGNLTHSFPLMSVVKPFLLLYLLCHIGEKSVFARVGKDSSSLPFNSLGQLTDDCNFPRNPMINSGAIALSELLPGKDSFSRCETLRLWLNQQANCNLILDELMLDSVNSSPKYRNQAIAFELAAAGIIGDWQIALDTYNHICCLSGTIGDLAQLGLLLVKPPSVEARSHFCTVKALMTTCGLYQASSRFAVKIGLPMKSGVSGAILAIVPRQGVIACYSPPLDEEGNSVVGLLLLEKIAQELHLSIFD